MKHNIFPSVNRTKLVSLCAALVVSVVLALPNVGLAQVVTLTSGNSSAHIDLGSSAGMDNWTVDGGNHLNQQWFWYRVGAGGLASSIDSIATPTYSLTGSDQVYVTYSNASFSVMIEYELTGGSIGSGLSQILESVMVNNHSGSSLDFHLFQYSDFNMGGTPGDDNVQAFYYSGPPVSGYNFVYQYDGLTEINENITDPPANRAEVDYYNNTLNNLTSTAGYNLSYTSGDTPEIGPGDVTWALQWDKSIPDGGSLDVFKNKSLSVTPVPEPSAAVLIALGLGAWGMIRRRR